MDSIQQSLFYVHISTNRLEKSFLPKSRNTLMKPLYTILVQFQKDAFRYSPRGKTQYKLMGIF